MNSESHSLENEDERREHLRSEIMLVADYVSHYFKVPIEWILKCSNEKESIRATKVVYFICNQRRGISSEQLTKSISLMSPIEIEQLIAEMNLWCDDFPDFKGMIDEIERNIFPVERENGSKILVNYGVSIRSKNSDWSLSGILNRIFRI